MKNSNRLMLALIATGLIGLLGCEKKTTPPTPSVNGSDTTAKTDATARDGAAGAQGHVTAGHHGAVIQLGSAQIGPFNVKAARDEGQILAGGDAPIDVWLTPAAEGASSNNIVAVRFWIGTQTGDESVKAKAEIENPAEPNHWHTHAEVPNPIPAGSKLWVEIEIESHDKQIGSFDLKM